MELKHLRSFLAVAEHLHFRRAAQTIHLSQPALSLQIRALEEELGVALFVRDRRKTLLTPAGRVFLHEAREMLARSERALSRARRAALGQVGVLRVGFVSTAGAFLMPPIVKRFRELYPDVELDLRNILSVDQIVQLRERRLDAGFLRLPVTAEEQLQTTVLHQEPFVVVLPAAHPLSRRKPLRLEDLRSANFVMYARKQAPGFHDRVVGILHDSGLTPHVVQEVSDIYSVVALVAAGLGVAVVPLSARLHQIPGVVTRKLPGRLPLSEIALAVHKNMTATTRLFAELAIATKPRNGLPA